MLRFMARPLAEVLGLYVRGPVMSVPALFLMNAGCGAGGRVTDLAIVAGGGLAGLGTVVMLSVYPLGRIRWQTRKQPIQSKPRDGVQTCEPCCRYRERTRLPSNVGDQSDSACLSATRVTAASSHR